MNKIISVIIFLCIAYNGFTQNVTIEKAKTVAVNWYRYYAPSDKKQGNVLKSKEYKLKEATNFYIFSFDKGGFVIISANDQVDPVLGYGFDGIVPDSITNPAVKEFLNNYARQIDTLGKLNLKVTKVNSKWNLLINNIFLKETISSIGPLLSTKWNQVCFYNAMCPADPAGPCGHVVTGCAALPTAQIMKFWSYPNQGKGSHSYTCSPYGTVSANFGTTTYNWSNMPNEVTEDNPDIATLLFHCGVAVDMTYSPTGSSAYGSAVRPAIINYFNYSANSQYIYRSSYTDLAWETVLKAEIDSLRPVWYQGSGTVGHAFVCDGYQNTNYFHFNWGWGGTYDGYFYLTNLNPGGYTFNNSQAAIIKIYPANGVLKSTVTQPATNVGCTDAILHGIVQPNSLTTNVSFEYGTTTNYGSTIVATQNPVTGNSNIFIDANVSGLMPVTVYHFRIKIVNTNGTFYGNDFTFLTKSEIWHEQISGTLNNLNTVRFIDSKIGYVGGDGGIILKTIDGGVSWNSLISKTTNNIKGLYFLDKNTGWAVGYHGTILKTIDGGTTWITQKSDTTTTNFFSVYFVDANNGWIGGEGKIYKTTDGGNTWSSRILSSQGSPIYSLFFLTSTDGYAAGWFTIMLEYYYGTWYSTTTNPVSKGFYGVHFPSPENGFSCGSSGYIYKMNPLDFSWNKLVSGASNDLKSIFFTDDNTGFTVGTGGKILNTVNSGTEWIDVPSGELTDLNSVNFPDKENGWVVGNNGLILNTKNGKNMTDYKLRLSVFLEGTFNGSGAMNIGKRIPLSQPYNVAPWNYAGTESVSAVPAGVVDWVLVEVRQATSPALATSATIVSKLAGFLKSDGTIVDLDGVSPLKIGRLKVTDNLYAVVRHRNHIPIMSANGMTLNTSVFSYDFTSSITQAYGSSAGYKQIARNKYGMVCGDAEGDGKITVLDFSKWATDFGKTGIYLSSDFDGDGQVTVLDFSIWALNFGVSIFDPLQSMNSLGSGVILFSQVPENK